MGDKISIWVGPPIAALIGERRAESRSGAINQVVGRYREICRRSLPVLTAAEWAAIFDALNGTWLLEAWSPAMLWAEIADCHGLGEKWGIDQAALWQRIRALPYVSLVAIADAAERWWAADPASDDQGWEPSVRRIVGDAAISAPD